MEQIHTGIDDGNRERSAFVLNRLLADEQILYIKTKNYSWNLRGRNFNSLNILFKQNYRIQDNLINELAERIRGIGHFACGSMKEYVELTRLKETNHLDGKEILMLKTLIEDHESIIKLVRNDIVSFDSKYMDLGNSYFVTSLLKKHESMAWKLRSSLEYK